MDDEAALRDVLSEALREHGYAVECAGDSEQALSWLEQSAFDLVLSDVVMPGMDGYQLAGLIRRRFPGMRLQMMSGYSDQPPLDAFGADLHRLRLHKPVNIRTLLTCLHRMLEMPQEEVTPSLPALPEASGNWEADLHTGIPELDLEHEVLIRHIKRCLELRHADVGPEKLHVELEALLDFARHHFRQEEAFLDACRTPNLPLHGEAHHLLQKGILQLLTDHARGEISADAVLEHLIAWFRGHIITYDHAAAEHLRAHAREF